MRTRAKPTARAVEPSRTAFKRAHRARKLSQEIIANSNNPKCAGRRPNNERNCALTEDVDGQAGQLSTTPCNSAAQQSLDQVTPTGRRDKRDKAQWRPHHDLASQRKRFSSQQQLLVMQACDACRPERARERPTTSAATSKRRRSGALAVMTLRPTTKVVAQKGTGKGAARPLETRSPVEDSEPTRAQLFSRACPIQGPAPKGICLGNASR